MFKKIIITKCQFCSIQSTGYQFGDELNQLPNYIGTTAKQNRHHPSEWKARVLFRVL